MITLKIWDIIQCADQYSEPLLGAMLSSLSSQNRRKSKDGTYVVM